MAVKNWTIDTAHSAMEFSVKHMMISTVRGKFEEFSGEISGDSEDFNSMNAKIVLKAKSIATGNQDRDNHLRSDDLFASEEFPDITFVSKKVSVNGEDLEILGDLTIRGTTKEVVLKGEYSGMVNDPWGNRRFGLTASTSINRQDYGVKWNMVLEGGGLMVGDKVNLIISLEAFAPNN